MILLISQCFNGVLLCRMAGGENSEYQTDKSGNADTNKGALNRERISPHDGGKMIYRVSKHDGNGRTEENSDNPAGKSQNDSFKKKL